VAKKTYIPGLQTSIDDEIANLAAAQTAQSAEAGLAVSEEYGSAGSVPPPSAGPAPAVKARRARQRGLPALLAAAGILLVLLLLAGIGLIALQFHPSRSTLPTQATPTSSGVATPTPSNSLSPSFASPGPAFTVLLVAVLVLGFIAVLVIWVVSRRRPALSGSSSDISTRAAVDANLSLQVQRLNQLRSWVSEDPDFSHLVDNIIGKQVKASERRQQIYSVIFGVASLVAGWLLSAFSSPIIHLWGQ
jgi:hypothetical protein